MPTRQTAKAMGEGESRSETREKILELAYAAFAKNGYAKTSLKTISEELGITRPALYYHFASKEDLFIAVYASIDTIGQSDASPALAATTREEFEEALRGYFETIFSGMSGDVERIRFSSVAEAAATEMPALRELVHDNDRALLDAIERMLAHGKDIDAIPASADVSALAKYLTLFVYGTSDAMLRGEDLDWQTVWPIVTSTLYA